MSTAKLKFTSVGVTSKYGPRILKLTGKPNFHEGADTATGIEYPHSSFGDGVVVHAGRGTAPGQPERGIFVQVQHAIGIETSYHSLDRVNVHKGQQIKMGDIIGWAGKSAWGATGNHVHNGLWLGGKHVDPLAYLTPGKVVTVSYGAPASSGSTPFPTTPGKPSTSTQGKALPMFSTYWTGPTPAKTNISGRVVMDYGSFHIPTMQIYNLLKRREDSARDGRVDNMLDAEHDIINGFLRGCFVSAQSGIALDASKFNLALSEELDKLGKRLLVDVEKIVDENGDEVLIDPAVLAAAFEGAIPRITASMMKQAGEVLVAGSATDSK